MLRSLPPPPFFTSYAPDLIKIELARSFFEEVNVYIYDPLLLVL